MQPCAHPPNESQRLFPARDYITGSQFEIARCQVCGLIVTTPAPSREEMSRFYAAAYYGDSSANRFPAIIERLQKLLYSSRASRSERQNGGRRGRVLDVGCGRGFLLEAFQNRGWEVAGTELSDQAARYARQVLRLPVNTGALEDLNFPANHFDAIVMWHVLEHLADPRPTLREVNRLLKPGGVFFVGVPNFGGWEARLGRDKWFHLDVPRHLVHFTIESLGRTLTEAGFHVRRTYGFAPEYDFFSFVQSCLNRLGLRHNLLYEILRGRGAKLFADNPAPWWQVAATLLFGVPLGILSIPFITLAVLFRQTGTVTVLAIKE